jgi:thiamine-phosphate pyrophosphorylase
LVSGNFLTQLACAARQKPQGILLREKDLDEAAYEALARQSQEICRAQGVELILHSRADAAKTLGVQRLHLPFSAFQENLRLANEFHVSVSVHSKEEALFCAAHGARLVILGHIFLTGCKPGVPARGLDFLREICLSVALPVFAIGGITEENAAEVFAAGAAGICRMSYWMRRNVSFLL